MIKASNITKSYNETLILNEIDFVVPKNKKIAIVGKNGCGKSTLFKLLADVETPTKGKIIKENEKIGYIPQEFNFKKDKMVGEFVNELLENDWDFYKVEAQLEQLQFSNYDEYQNISTLSEGQKMKLKMIEVLLKEPTTLLLDEPTNHLDIEGVMWFENYIKNLNIPVLMISHDREFLNNTVDEIWEIDKGVLRIYMGNYDKYKEEKLKLINKWNEEYSRFIKRKKQLEDLLERSKQMNISRSGKGTQSVKKRIEREIEGNKKEKYEILKMNKVSFDTSIHKGKLIVKIENASKKYGNNIIFSNLNLEIRGKERVWIYGKNGTGKSTLIKIINTALSLENKKNFTNIGSSNEKVLLSSGSIKAGPNLKIGYFAQNQNFLNFDKLLKEEVFEKTNLYTLGQMYSLLEKFLFTKEDAEYKRIKDLSPGQRARFIFALYSVNDYDVLILDEPTNHLDIKSKEVIEESLQDYKGTIILVSHDRYFVEKVNITKAITLE